MAEVAVSGMYLEHLFTTSNGVEERGITSTAAARRPQSPLSLTSDPPATVRCHSPWRGTSDPPIRSHRWDWPPFLPNFGHGSKLGGSSVWRTGMSAPPHWYLIRPNFDP